MATLGFDTATEDTAVAAVNRERVLYESLLGLSEKGSPQHTTALLGEIERAVEAAGGWAQIDAIGVGVGPGSFTGLRVGVATARALGLSRGLEVRGVGTLAALGRGLDGGASIRVPVLDARRGEVFAAAFAARGDTLLEPFVCPPAGLADRIAGLGGPFLCAGSGAVRFRQELAGPGVEIPDDADPAHRIAARQVCALAAAGVGAEAEPAAPNYLRPPDAERWRERDTIQTPE
ncbi:MAG TPA: tRNA (adenosine(37)-N6)-threonylcarbamoyltransferase complex dimerization subunit type 1 TsaB [Solirubrobacterales bacterium]